jgi:hypothetical protein
LGNTNLSAAQWLGEAAIRAGVPKIASKKFREKDRISKLKISVEQ